MPATIITSTNGAGQTVTTTSPLSTVKVGNGGSVIGGGATQAVTTTDSYGNEVVLSGTKKGQVITTTDAAGRTVVMTYTPPGGAVSQVVVRTTQLPNGEQSTYTSLTRVGGAGGVATATVGADGGGSGDSQGDPNLQSGASSPPRGYILEIAAMFAGAIGVAALL